MLNLDKKINGTTANFPGTHYQEAVNNLKRGVSEPSFGLVAAEHVQLCPQNRGHISDEFCEQLRSEHPNTQFRLHANARVNNRLEMFDASYDMVKHQRYIDRLKQTTSILNSPIYSYHAGRKTVSFEEMLTNVLALQDFLQIPVAVEGLYPSKTDDWLLSSFDDYASLLKHDVHYAVDLSHLQIVCRQERRDVSEVTDVIRKLVSHERCLEIHLSDNNNVQDSHQLLKTDKWWFNMLENCQLNDQTVIFTEGNHLSKRSP